MKSNKIIDKVSDDAGIGRIVDLDKESTLKDIINITKTALNAKSLKYVGELDSKISKVAVINGSGQSYIEAARKLGANLIITGDTTYHFASDYKEMGMSIIDVGHFNSEWPILIEVSKRVEKRIKEKYEDVEFIISSKSEDPFKFN